MYKVPNEGTLAATHRSVHHRVHSGSFVVQNIAHLEPARTAFHAKPLRRIEMQQLRLQSSWWWSNRAITRRQTYWPLIAIGHTNQKCVSFHQLPQAPGRDGASDVSCLRTSGSDCSRATAVERSFAGQEHLVGRTMKVLDLGSALGCQVGHAKRELCWRKAMQNGKYTPSRY